MSDKSDRVDDEELIRVLSTYSITSSPKVDDGRVYFECEIIGDKSRTLRVYNLTDEELVNYELLCTTEGQFFFHCLSMGRHTDNFLNRVVGYQILEPTRNDMKLRVVFYEKKKTA